MKNNASNSSIIQVLQAQAQQLLPAITQALSVWQYTEIAHQRLGQQTTVPTKTVKTPIIEKNSYQGLTRAKHPQFGSVMIKWQLCANDITLDTSQSASDLNHEISVLRALHISQKNQSNTITPSVLAYHNLAIQALGERQQLTVLVMPYYANGNLAKQLINRNHSLLTDKQKHHFIHQTTYLVANLHNAGWLHNDLKPSNILLDGHSVDKAENSRKMADLLITDFALAERVDKPREANLAGTPAYLAPERWQGQAATAQSDIYALGIMMVEILVGNRPFKVNTQSSDPLMDWAIQHCQQPIPKLPIEYAHYQSIIDRALAKRVERRYESMDELLEILKSL